MYDLNKIAPSIRHRILRANLPMKSIGMELSDLNNGPAVDKVKKNTSCFTLESENQTKELKKK